MALFAMKLFLVCPFPSASFGYGDPVPVQSFLKQLARHADWAERHGFYGMMFYNFRSAMDPWTLAVYVMAQTNRLVPLVAVQPMGTHPYDLAKKLVTTSYLFSRTVDLNIVAGFSQNELDAYRVEDMKSVRYERLEEFIEATKQLLSGIEFYTGKYYHLRDESRSAQLHNGTISSFYVPVSTHNEVAVSKHADKILLMGKPYDQLRRELSSINNVAIKSRAMIIGIVARPTSNDAWNVANHHYATNMKEKMAARLMLASASSSQHKQITDLAHQKSIYDDCLWYGAARIGVDCPKLVGSYDEVVSAIMTYQEIGIDELIVDLPHEFEEYQHVEKVMARIRL